MSHRCYYFPTTLNYTPQGYEKVRQSLADGMLCEQSISDLMQEALQGSPEPYQALGVLGALAEEEALRGKTVGWDPKVSGESNVLFFSLTGRAFNALAASGAAQPSHKARLDLQQALSFMYYFMSLSDPAPDSSRYNEKPSDQSRQELHQGIIQAGFATESLDLLTVDGLLDTGEILIRISQGRSGSNYGIDFWRFDHEHFNHLHARYKLITFEQRELSKTTEASMALHPQAGTNGITTPAKKLTL